MSFINRAEVSAAGVLGDSVALPAESAGVLGGINYVSAASGTLSATPTDPAGPDDGAYVDAFRFNAQGQMFIWNFDSRGLPPGGVFYTGGLPFTKDGQLVVTAQPVAWYVGGWPLALNNYVVGVPTGGGSVPGPFTFDVILFTEQANVAWTASAGASVYEIRLDGVLIATVNAPSTGTLTTRPFVGGTYAYTMAAINGTGTTQSSSNPQNVDVVSRPAQPAAPTAVAGDTTATITFVPPFDGGDPINQYQIQAFVGVTSGAVQTTSSPSPYVFTGLTNGVTYTFKIAATNAIGQSVYSPNSNAVTPTSAAPPTLFIAPLISTLVPTQATGAPTATFSRPTDATVTDNLGNLFSGLSTDVARFSGARKVYNQFQTTQSPFSLWITTGLTATMSQTDPIGGTGAARLTATAPNGSFTRTGNRPSTGSQVIASYWVRRVTGTGTVLIKGLKAAQTDITAQLTGTWKRFATPATDYQNVSDPGIMISTTGDAVDFAFAQLESIYALSPAVPSEYVSRGFLSAPWHGAGADGDKYFDTANANTVTSNVVNEIAGAPISAATLRGYRAEGQATNLCLRSIQFADANWSKNFMTALDNQTMSPGSFVEGATLTATASVATINQGVNTGSGIYTFSIYLKRRIGVGNIEISTDGASWTNIAPQINASTWTRVSVTDTPGSGQGFCGVRISANGDSVYAWGAQLETGSFATSFIQSVNAALTRSPDLLNYVYAGNFNSALGSASVEAISFMPTGIGGQYLAYLGTTGYPFVVAIGGGVTINAGGGIAFTANLYTPGTPFKAASRWAGAASDFGVILNAGVIAGGANGTMPGTAFRIGYDGSSNNLFGNLKNLKIYSVALSDAQMVAVTT